MDNNNLKYAKKEKKKMFPYCYFNKQHTLSSEAKLGIASQSIQYGMTCFGGIRGYRIGQNIRIFRLEDHFKRLLLGAKILDWDVNISYEEFKEIMHQLIQLNQPQGDFYIRPFFYTDDEGVAPHFIDKSFQLAIYFVALGNYFDPNKGLRMMISSWRKFPDSSISVKAKAGGCYLNSALATTEAKRCGYDEALMLDQQGYIVEASVANLLLSYRDELYVPPVGSSVLDGFTMRTVLEVLNREGINIKREPIDRSMVYSASELILTGTGAQIVFASSVDNRPIGSGDPGPICKLLREKFTKLIREKKTEWITEIKLKD